MQDFLQGLLRVSMYGSLSAVLLVLLRQVSARFVSRSVIYYLWLLVLLRLCIPAGITITLPDISGSAVSDDDKNTVQIPRDDEASVQKEAVTSAKTAVYMAKAEHADQIQIKKGPDPYELCAAVWGIGVLACLGWQMRASLYFSRKVRRSMKEADAQARAVLQELEPEGRVRLAESDVVKTPMLLGVFHPVIAFPVHMNGRIGKEVLSDVIAHELVHAKRHDLLYKWFVRMVISLHWFNPLMYLVWRETDRCCELSCDEAVIHSMSAQERRRYGQTLLDMAGASGKDGHRSTAALCREKAWLKERLVSIGQYQKRGMQAVLCTLPAMLAVSGCAVISDVRIGKMDDTQTYISQESAETQSVDTADGISGTDKNQKQPESQTGTQPSSQPESRTGTQSSAQEDNTGTQPLSQDDSAGQQLQEEMTDDEEPELYYEKNGRQYELVQDLITGEYLWANVLTKGRQVKDDHGHEKTDHTSQEHFFEKLDGTETYTVRRWDNLLYSAKDYLVFEYDGMVHVSKSTDLYHPVLSYEIEGTYGIITKIPKGYMTADYAHYKICYYDEKFRQIKVVTGLRAGENSIYYADGLMAVRDMETGKMGFLDQQGKMVIPCQYAQVSGFSNGYASVLTDAEIVPYTEDGGTVQMYYGKGGQWGIIDRNGQFVIEPSAEYANESPDDTDTMYVSGVRRFGPVRENGTVDFIAADQGERVLKTIKIW